MAHGSHGYDDKDKPRYHFLRAPFLCNGARQPWVDVLASVAK